MAGRRLTINEPEEQRDRESRGISVKEYPAGDLSFLFEIPAVNSQSKNLSQCLITVLMKSNFTDRLLTL